MSLIEDPLIKEVRRMSGSERMSVGYGLECVGGGIAWAGFWIGLGLSLMNILKVIR